MGAFSFPSGRGLFSAPTSLILASVAAAGVSFLLVFSPIVPKIKKYLKRLTLLRQLETAKFVKIGHVSALNVYPIKSAKGIPLPSLHCGQFGVSRSADSSLLDRGWLVIFGETNRFVTMRQEPSLVLIGISFDDATMAMTLTAPNMPSLTFTTPSTSLVQHPVRHTKVFGVASSGIDCGDAVADWLSQFLGKPGHRLIFKSPVATANARDIADTIPWNDADVKSDIMYRHISYQDEAPVLVTNAASLESLNTQLKSAIEMKRFRPNVVISGADAWMEDRWEHLAFCRPGTDPNANPGGRKVVLRRVTPSLRCKVPTVNPETGVMDPEEEPLRTLKEFHPWTSLDGEKDESQKSKGVFGNCMGIVVEGQVDEGDEVWALVSSYEKKVVK